MVRRFIIFLPFLFLGHQVGAMFATKFKECSNKERQRKRKGYKEKEKERNI